MRESNQVWICLCCRDVWSQCWNLNQLFNLACRCHSQRHSKARTAKRTQNLNHETATAQWFLYLAVPSHQILDWLNQCKFVSVWIWICRVWLFVVIDITRCRETPCNWFIISYIHYSTLYTYLLYVWADLKSQISQPKLTICCPTSHCSQQEWIDLNHLFHSLWSYTHTIYRIGLNGQIWQTFRCLSCKTRSDSQLQQAEMIQHTEGPYRQTCVMSSSWD